MKGSEASIHCLEDVPSNTIELVRWHRMQRAIQDQDGQAVYG